uniref:Uncharacterized protein n=1 Tax=Glossina austeni TaxID=7395 RepID=A0A1A9VXZ6_GLOAU
MTDGESIVEPRVQWRSKQTVSCNTGNYGWVISHPEETEDTKLKRTFHKLADLVNKINQYGEDDITHHIMKALYKPPEPDLSSSKQKRIDHKQTTKKDNGNGKTTQLKLGPDSSKA